MQDFKVLLVDDEEDFLVSLSERLQLRDVSPDTAASGEEALERIREVEPTIIVLDLKMPGLHGLEDELTEHRIGGETAGSIGQQLCHFLVRAPDRVGAGR